MKKWFLIFVSLLVLSVFVSCASTKDNEDQEQPQELSEIEVSSKDISKWRKESRGSAGKENSSLKIKTKGKLGTFNIYIKDRDDRNVPVFSTQEEFTGTSFYLQAGKKIYKLSGGSNVTTASRETENGVQIVYIIPNIAQVFVDFTIFSSDGKRDGDMIKVSAYVRNLRGKAERFALKLLLDTSIGEKSRYHFYDSENGPVKTETLYRSVLENPWLTTGNDQTNFQIILNGADISPFDYIAVGNFETLNTMSWEPSMVTGRSFDTVSSYNNSAVEMAWKSYALEADGQSENIMYFAVSAFPGVLNGEYFLENYKAPEKKTEVVAESGTEIITADGNDSGNNESAGPLTVRESEDPEITLPPTVSSGNTPLSPSTVEYVQRILDRIAELETGDKEINSEELLLLNEELDEILLRIRDN